MPEHLVALLKCDIVTQLVTFCDSVLYKASNYSIQYKATITEELITIIIFICSSVIIYEGRHDIVQV